MKNILKYFLLYIILSAIYITSSKNIICFIIFNTILILYIYKNKSFFCNLLKEFKNNIKGLNFIYLLITLVLITICYNIFWKGLMYLCYHLSNIDGFILGNHSITNIYTDFIYLIIFAPILEEFIFRYIIFSELLKKYNIYISLITSSLIFSIIHTDGMISIIYAIIWGIILSIIFYITKSILYCIFIHSLSNLLSFLEIINIINFKSFYTYMNNNFIYTIPPIIISVAILTLYLKWLKNMSNHNIYN